MTAAELLLPDQTTLRGASEALAAAFPIQDGVTAEHDRAYYDTFDGLLHAAGLSLVHSDGMLSLVELDSGAVRASLAMSSPRTPVFASEIAPGALREALSELIELRAALPLARVHARKRLIAVLDRHGKTVVRLALEEPALVGRDGADAPLRPRLRITPVRGYDKARRRVEHTLNELGFRAADQPLVDEAVRAAGGVPGGIPTKVELPLRRDERADAAAGAVLRALLDVIEANLEGAIADTDSEFLHDLRVSVRRSRAVQREFAGVFPPARLAHFRTEFRWLQQATGDARDLDVHVLEFDAMRALVGGPGHEFMRDDLDPLLGVLRARRRRARRRMVAALRSERTTELLTSWRDFLDGLEAAELAERPDAARPIADLAGERVRKVYRRMVRMGSAIDESSPAADYHELRKKGKELRYLLELFGGAGGGLFPGEVVRPMVRTLKGLQDVLGRHQDREVQVALLRSVAHELIPDQPSVSAQTSAPAHAPTSARTAAPGVPTLASQGGERALLAIGALVARLCEDARAARGEFAARFAEFAAKEQRRLVKETFG
jgi:CHAD domain-containing protein